MRYLLILLIFLNGCAFGNFSEDGKGSFIGYGEYTDGEKTIKSDPPLQLPKLEFD